MAVAATRPKNTRKTRYPDRRQRCFRTQFRQFRQKPEIGNIRQPSLLLLRQVGPSAPKFGLRFGVDWLGMQDPYLLSYCTCGLMKVIVFCRRTCERWESGRAQSTHTARGLGADGSGSLGLWKRCQKRDRSEIDTPACATEDSFPLWNLVAPY